VEREVLSQFDAQLVGGLKRPVCLMDAWHTVEHDLHESLAGCEVEEGWELFCEGGSELHDKFI